MIVSFCLPHPVTVSDFYYLYRFVYLYGDVVDVSFGSKVRHKTCGCVAMGSVLWFVIRSRLLVYSAGSGVNRVQVVWSGFSMFCFVQALCRYGCMYFLSVLMLVCVDVIVMSSA